MRIGFGAPVSGAWATPANLASFTAQAEAAGYASVWTFQRLIVPEGSAMEPVYHSVLDPMVALGYAAAGTSRIRLGVAVVNMPYLSPAYLAKQAATVDVLSAGRLDLGLGLGWMPEEFTAAGGVMAGRGARAARRRLGDLQPDRPDPDRRGRQDGAGRGGASRARPGGDPDRRPGRGPLGRAGDRARRREPAAAVGQLRRHPRRHRVAGRAGGHRDLLRPQLGPAGGLARRRPGRRRRPGHRNPGRAGPLRLSAGRPLTPGRRRRRVTSLPGGRWRRPRSGWTRRAWPGCWTRARSPSSAR